MANANSRPMGVKSATVIQSERPESPPGDSPASRSESHWRLANCGTMLETAEPKLAGPVP